MDHFLVFALLAVGYSAYVDAKSDEEACINLLKSMKHSCCLTIDAMKNEDDYKCEKDEKDWTCEDSKCVLEKRGLLNNDTVDEETFSKMIDEWVSNDGDVTLMRKQIEKSCLGGKYKELPPDDQCDATKFHICVGVSAMVECQRWKDSDECKGLPEDAKQCKNMFDKQ